MSENVRSKRPGRPVCASGIEAYGKEERRSRTVVRLLTGKGEHLDDRQ